MLSLEVKLSYLIFMYLFFVAVLHNDFHQLTQYIHTLHYTLAAVLRGHKIPDIGQSAVQLLIGLLLVFQTAHQTAADAGDLLIGRALMDASVGLPGIVADEVLVDEVANRQTGSDRHDSSHNRIPPQ